jgi:hypothetical protein
VGDNPKKSLWAGAEKSSFSPNSHRRCWLGRASLMKASRGRDGLYKKKGGEMNEPAAESARA